MTELENGMEMMEAATTDFATSDNREAELDALAETGSNPLKNWKVIAGAATAVVGAGFAIKKTADKLKAKGKKIQFSWPVKLVDKPVEQPKEPEPAKGNENGKNKK